MPDDTAPFTPPATREDAIRRIREDGDADPEGTARLNYPELFPDVVEGLSPGASTAKARRSEP